MATSEPSSSDTTPIDEPEEDQDPPQIDWDWTASVALPHFAFMLSYMLPLRHIERKFNETLKREVQAQLLAPEGAILLVVGSVAEGLELPAVVNRPFDDISPTTILIIPDGFVTSSDPPDYKGDTTTCCVEENPAGFVRLKTTEGYLATNETEQYKSKFLSLQSLDHRGTKKRMENATVAIKHAGWPAVAREWKTRSRPAEWPLAGLIATVVSGGCHLIPSRRPGCKDKTEWQYDFSMAEQKLSSTLTDMQRQCFLYYKILYYMGFDYPKFLTEEHLKWIFLMVCERIPQSEWTEQELGPILLCLVDETLHALINGQLPHYFINTMNTIDHIPEDFVFDLMARISKVRQEALQNLFRFNRIYKFQFWPKTQDFEQIFQPVVSDMEEQHDNLAKSVSQAFRTAGTDLTKTYIKEANCAEACSVYDAVLSMLEEQFRGQFKKGNLLDQLSSLALQLGDMDSSIGLQEYLIETNATAGKLYSIKGNLACIYSNKYHTLTDDTEKAEVLKKTEALFQEALTDPDASSATHTDYANFLCGMGRHADAMPNLLNVIMEERQTPKSANCYTQEELYTVDENVQREIEHSGDMSIPSVVYAMYLLTQAYIKTDQLTETSTHLNDFQLVCEALRETDQAPHCYSLLGYAYQSVENFEGAAKAFETAASLKPRGYSLATENAETCKAIMLSQGLAID